MKKIKPIIIFVLLGCLIIYFYNDLSNRTALREGATKTKTELEMLTDRDLEKDYPVSPRDVVKLYSDIIKELFNNETLKETSITALNDQLRNLLDEELLAVNPKEDQWSSLMKELGNYGSKTKVLTSYTMTEVSQVVYKTIGQEDYAELEVVYSVKDSSAYTKIPEQFILRKDKDDKWKILGYRISEDALKSETTSKDGE